jgi:hypothetical protein
MTLVISPMAGFGNRLRTLAGGILTAEKFGLKPYHLWDGGEYETVGKYRAQVMAHVQATHDNGFEFYFDPNIPVYTGDAPEIYYNNCDESTGWFHYQNYAYKRFGVKNVNLIDGTNNITSKSVCIEGSIAAYPFPDQEYTRVYKKFFVPKGVFLEKVPSLPENTIGIAVRNAYDFRFFFGGGVIEEDGLRPFLESFDGPVLIVSDDNDYAVRLRTFLKNPIHLSFEKTETNASVRGFLEFLTLSRCSKVFGFKDSSFAEQAALFGGAEYEVLSPHAKTL